MKKKSNNKMNKILSLTLLSILVSHNCYANQEKPSKNDITVSESWLGSGSSDDVKKYPGARTVITEKEIKNSGATTVQDVLRDIPGVRIQDETAGTGILPNIAIRGLNPLRSVDLQVLVDGIPLALGPYSATGLSLFPVSLNMIQKIDIVRGGAAVQYGPNNVGGVINIITKPIPLKPETVLGQRVSVAPTGKILSNTYLQTGGYLTDKFGAQIQANFTRGNGDREHSNTTVDNFLLNTEYWISDSTEIQTNLQYYHANAELPGALTPEQYEQNWRQSLTPYNKYLSDTYRSSIILKSDFDDKSQLIWKNYYNYSNRNFIFSSPVNVSEQPITSIMQSPRRYQTFGTEPQYSFFIDTPVKQKMIVGMRYLYEDIFYPVYSQNIGSNIEETKRNWKSDTNALSAYISDTFYFDNDKLQITPGLRFESVHQNFRDKINTDNSKENIVNKYLPGITIGYQATKDIYLFTNAQKSLLPPQMTQVANSSGSELTPELANNYEIGTRASLTDEVQTTLTLFKTDFKNKIEKEGSLNLVNVGASIQQGIESTIKYSPYFINGLTLNLGYTYLDAEIKEGVNKGNRLPYTSKNQFSVSSNYEYKTWNYNVSGYYLSKAFSDAANTSPQDNGGINGPIPSYWLWNASINKQTKLSNDTNLFVSFSILNLFDKRYYFRNVDVSGGITPAPGRTFVLDTQIKF